MAVIFGIIHAHHVRLCIYIPQTNSFQVAAVTDGRDSYAVFTYRCGSMDWSASASIGFSTGERGYFRQHQLSGTSDANAIACLDSSIYTNVIYKLTDTGMLRSKCASWQDYCDSLVLYTYT